MFDKQKKKKNGYNRRLRKRLIVLLTIVVAIVGVGLFGAVFTACGCSVTKHPVYGIFTDTTTELSGDEAQSQIEKILKITLPDSVQGTYFYSTTWQDYIMQLRIDLPAGQLPAILAGVNHLCFDLSQQEEGVSFTTIDVFLDWWQPQQAEQFITVPHCSDFANWHLIIDQSDDEIWIVYIEAFIA